MRLRRSGKIAVSAVCAAIAVLCVVLARFTPIGWIALFAVSGAVTLLAKRMCGFGYGILTYVATSLLSLVVLPYCLPYILLFGLHALLREALFGKPPVRPARRAVGIVVLLAAFYGIALALLLLVGAAFELQNIIDAVGGVFVLAAIAAPILLAYDFGVSYLADKLALALAHSRPRKKPAAPPPEDPFAEPSESPHTTEQPHTDDPSAPPAEQPAPKDGEQGAPPPADDGDDNDRKH